MRTDKQLTITVLGTGLIGAPVARNLRKRGFAVYAWNRTALKAQALVADGIQAFDSPADALRHARPCECRRKRRPAVA